MDRLIDRRIATKGAVAQLGERLLCKQEVVGSIPSGSTIRLGYGEGWRSQAWRSVRETDATPKFACERRRAGVLFDPPIKKSSMRNRIPPMLVTVWRAIVF